MANTISNVYIEGFDANVRQLAQQKTTRVLPYVQIRSSTAAAENWETLTKSDWAPKVSRGAATPEADVLWGRRQSGNTVYDNGELVGAEDITQMLADPNSNIARNFAMGGARSQDQVIITAATGSATDGDGNAVVFDTGQIVGDYSTQISFDAITEISEKFLENDIDATERKVALIGPAQMRKLLQTVEATNHDYAAVKSLPNGYVASFMGFNFIVSTLLGEGGGAGTTTDCIFMTDLAMGLQMNQDISTKVQMDPSASFDWRLYSSWQGGAVRVEDQQLVWGQFLD